MSYLIPDDGQPDSATVCGWVGTKGPCDLDARYSVRQAGLWWSALCTEHTAAARRVMDLDRVTDVRAPDAGEPMRADVAKVVGIAVQSWRDGAR